MTLTHGPGSSPLFRTCIVLTHEKILSEKSGGIAWGHGYLIQVDFHDHKGHRAEISITTLISGPSPI